MADWGQDDRVTLITGATGYLGRALAKGFTDAGAKLFLTGRNEAALSELARELGNDRVHTFAADLTDETAASRVINYVLDQAGRIDTLVINAGTLADGLVAGLSDEELSRVYEVNVWAAFRLLR